MRRWGAAVVRARWAVLVGSVGVMVAAGVYGTGVFGALTDGGFEDPAAESARADERVAATFGRQDADVLVVYRPAAGSDSGVDSAAFEAAVQGVVDDLPDDGVAAVATPFQPGGSGLVSDDGESALVTITLVGSDDDALAAAYEQVADRLDAPGLTSEVGGPLAVFDEVGTQVEEDIARAESLTLPIVASWVPSRCCGCSPPSPTCPSSRSTSSRCSGSGWRSTTRCSSSAGSARSWPVGAARRTRSWRRWRPPGAPWPSPG